MLYEQRLRARTFGLVQGPSLLTGFPAAVVPIRGKRELFVDETLQDLRELPHGPCITTFNIVIRAREGGEVLWTRPFATKADALTIWLRLIDRRPLLCPTTWRDGELEYLFLTINQYTTVGSTTWFPVGGTAGNGDLLIVAGGGGSKGYGGGGAGGMQTHIGVNLIPQVGGTVTVGGGSSGANGGNSGFGGYGCNGGGYGGTSAVAGATGGSGGGGGGPSSGVGGTSGGAGVAGQGYAGADGFSDGATYTAGGGGGGKASAGGGIYGGAGASSYAGTGGDGLQSSMTGSAVYYAAGGGGYNNVGSWGYNGTGYRAAANSGCGSANGAAVGWSGFVVVSYTPIPFYYPPMDPRRRKYLRK